MPTASSSSDGHVIETAEAFLGFDLIGSEGPQVSIGEVVFPVVLAQDLDLRSAGPVGAGRHQYGVDAGAYRQKQGRPAPTPDLPPGFQEAFRPS